MFVGKIQAAQYHNTATHGHQCHLLVKYQGACHYCGNWVQINIIAYGKGSKLLAYITPKGKTCKTCHKTKE